MTTTEAQNSIGKEFKPTGMGIPWFDTILSVDADGIIHGERCEAHAEHCRLKGEQPEQLRRFHTEHENSLTSNANQTTLF